MPLCGVGYLDQIEVWRTLCVSVNGQIYAFGGNQIGQLSTGSEHPEVCFP